MTAINISSAAPISARRLRAIQPTLLAFADRLKRTEWNTDTFERAFDRCYSTSIAFMWFCIGRGISGCGIEEFCSPSRPFTNTTALSITSKIRVHNVAIIRRNIYVDWTARQFWDEAPYPLVMSAEELATYWSY